MSNLDDLTFNTMYAVMQSGMWLLNDLEVYLRPLNMSQARLTILLTITAEDDGFISPKDIARITGKSRPAITRTIEKLSDDGLITIAGDDHDGRRKKLSLTDSGKQLLDRIVPEYNSRIIQMSAGLSTEEKRLLFNLLGKIDFLDSEKKVRV